MDRFEEVRDRIKEATDLGALIESYGVPLRSTGRNLVALCPFHQEKTASFYVYPDSQHYRCYGCGKSGDVFNFVMEREGVDFRECCEMLAQRAGISTDGAFGGRANRDRRGPDPHAVMAELQGYFRDVLRGPEGGPARQYLAERGLEGAVDPFGLGAHPARPGSLVRFAREKKLPFQILEQAGLLRPGRGAGGSHEPYLGRLMFPIEDARGRVVAFGGRVLDDGKPKYLNSAESPFFRKRKVLYGLRQAKDAGERQIVVVEGYTDVLAAHLAGVHGAVATLGTSLTRDHGSVLGRYATDGVVVLFDGDEAGRRAAEKAYEELVRTELAVRVALLPDGMDPADLLAPRPGVSDDELAAGRRRFEEVVDGAEEALDMWFRLKRARLDLTLEGDVASVVADCGRVLEGVEDPTRREVLVSRMARLLGRSEDALRRTLARRVRRPRPERAPRSQSSSGPPTSRPWPSRMSSFSPASWRTPHSPAGSTRTRSSRFPTWPRCSPRLAMPPAAACSCRTSCCGSSSRSARAGPGRPSCWRVAPTWRGASSSRTRPSRRWARHRRAHRARQAAQRTRYELQEARARQDQEKIDELTQLYVAQLREQEAV